MKKIYYLLAIVLCISQISIADDTEIYSVSTISVQPNVLIIFDNSGSMGTQDVIENTYDPNTTYTGSYSSNAVYQWESYWWYGGTWTKWYDDINNSNWKCDTAKNELIANGFWQGNIQINSGEVTCGGFYYNNKMLRLGNYMNFIASGLGEKKTRMEVAQKVIKQLVEDNYDNVRFGLMRFNYDEGGYIVAGCGSTKTDLINAVDALYPETWTPLAETLAEAGRYFAGAKSWFNGTTTTTTAPYGKYSSTCTNSTTGDYCQDYSNASPIQYRCQNNYVIFITDGEPTQDDNYKLASVPYLNGIKIPAAGHDGASDYLDDVAYFLAHNDLLPTSSNPSTEELLQKGEPGDFEYQTVKTYTIGFKQNLALLSAAATNGGGVYYTADNASTLNEALTNIISAIKNDNEGFSAAAVPVSRANKAYAGNYVYYGLFQPQNNSNWVGNLKKYGITDMGVITDANGVAVESGGEIITNAQSYWSSVIDGPSVIKGGAGQKLLNDLENGLVRNIYTYTGTTSSLTDNSNKFISTNTSLLTLNSNLTESIINDIRHENDNDWPLGSLLHSQPLVVHYTDKSMIFAGANDGMLHCFDDSDGSEKWGFIPQDLLSKIDQLPTATALQYYVDGSPELYSFDDNSGTVTVNNKILIFGERRGGNNYIALDVTNYDDPLLKYTINANILGGGSKVLGQSWGKPYLCKIGYMDGTTYSTKDAFILSGGYDTNQDSDSPATSDDEGRAIFAIDAQSGTLQSNVNFNIENVTNMTHSIVAVAAFENPKSRTTTRLYAGDMNGNLFAFRDDIFHRNTDPSLKDQFEGHYDGQEDGTWDQKLTLFSSPGKKIFYPPNILNVYFPVQFTYPAVEVEGSEDVTQTELRVGDYVFYGTGDREHPNDKTVENEFYAIKNNWQWSTSTPSIKKAYVDSADGSIRDKTTNNVLVARDTNGELDTSSSIAPFIIDVTDDLYQTVATDEETEKNYQKFSSEAINHPSNKGWYIRFAKEDGTLEGEKMVSTPIIYGGVIYFTTYVPDSGTTSLDEDPCASPGANGTGYLYAIGVRYGQAIMNLDTSTTSTKLTRSDRRKKLTGKGIPPEPVLVIHEGKATIVTGFETIEPHFTQSLEPFYWRQLYN